MDIYCFYFYLECVFVSDEDREELGKRGGQSLTNVALHLPALMNFARKIDYTTSYQEKFTSPQRSSTFDSCVTFY